MDDLPSPAPAPHAAPVWVLDSNVVLDWLLFGSASGLALGATICQGRARWLRTTAMRDELAHVLAYRDFGRWTAAARELHGRLEHFDRHAESAVAPPPDGASIAARWRCRDADDQKFIDLARSLPGCWLLSRDRAVLKLAGKARSAGFRIVTPEQLALQAAG